MGAEAYNIPRVKLTLRRLMDQEVITAHPTLSFGFCIIQGQFIVYDEEYDKHLCFLYLAFIMRCKIFFTMVDI